MEYDWILGIIEYIFILVSMSYLLNSDINTIIAFLTLTSVTISLYTTECSGK